MFPSALIRLKTYGFSFSRCYSERVESTYDIGNCWAKVVLMFGYDPILLIDGHAETVSPSNSSILENRLALFMICLFINSVLVFYRTVINRLIRLFG